MFTTSHVKQFAWVGAVAAIAAVAAIVGGARLASADRAVTPASVSTPDSLTPVRTITVSGEGKVTVTPDMATVNLGAQANGPSAAAALDEVNTTSAALIQAIKAAGVADDDIRTSGLSVRPTYDRDNKVSGFEARNSVTVQVRRLANAGQVIDAAVAAAGDNVTISGIRFDVQDQEAVLGEARAAAIDNAKKRAQEYASAAGVSVGEVLTISEVGVSLPPLYMEWSVEAADAVAAAPTPVQPGTRDLTVDVTVVFRTA